MKKVVKAKNLIAFRIWLEKLGYSVKNLADGKGFTFSFKKDSVHDKFHRTLILSGFCLLKIAKISL
ncbi:hypothetical protein KR578_14650, partial [Acinetobacter baumannii]|nr:hypothetical protein [Acinetobacter baumannii]MCE6621878.1 hypothetical protein [Acinetobacter baumannii]